MDLKWDARLALKFEMFFADSNGNGSLSLAHDSTVKRLLTLNVE